MDWVERIYIHSVITPLTHPKVCIDPSKLLYRPLIRPYQPIQMILHTCCQPATRLYRHIQPSVLTHPNDTSYVLSTRGTHTNDHTIIPIEVTKNEQGQTTC